MYTDTHAADAAVGETVETTAVEAPKSSGLKVPVTKSKGFIEVDTSKLPDAVYREAMILGLKALANRGMTKITKETYPNADELKVAAQAQAEKNLAAMYSGKVRISGSKADKVSGKVMTEARRLAKITVKEALKAENIKLSHVSAKDITAAANALIAADPEYVEKAKATIEALDNKQEASAKKIDVRALVPVDPKKVKAEADEKAAAAATLSKTQASKTQVRSRPQAR